MSFKQLPQHYGDNDLTWNFFKFLCQYVVHRVLCAQFTGHRGTFYNLMLTDQYILRLKKQIIFLKFQLCTKRGLGQYTAVKRILFLLGKLICLMKIIILRGLASHSLRHITKYVGYLKRLP